MTKEPFPFYTFAGVGNKGCCAIIGNTNRSNRVLR